MFALFWAFGCGGRESGINPGTTSGRDASAGTAPSSDSGSRVGASLGPDASPGSPNASAGGPSPDPDGSVTSYDGAESFDASPSGSCPASEPNASDPCTWPAAAVCAYTDPCPAFGCQDTFTCVAGHYQVSSCAYALGCPLAAPKDGDSCACGTGHSVHHYGEGRACNFACAEGKLTATCDQKTEQWTVAGPTEPTECTPSDGGAPGEGAAGDGGVPIDAGDAADSSRGCTGTAPNCFGNDVHACCGQDPAGRAICEGGTWMCGGAPAPGCNGSSCLHPRDAGAD
jgi:hypothetical protein